MPGSEDIARWVGGIFRQFAVDMAQRMANGRKQREAVSAQIQRGEEPTGYRAEWVRDTARFLLSEPLTQAIARFEALHPDDAISYADLQDVLATATYLLTKSAEKKGG